MKNKITDLRNHLFESIELLKEKKIDVATAKAISELGQTIINSGKLELEFIDKTGMKKGVTDFMPLEEGTPEKKNSLRALELKKA